jgi:hypothetical protein
MKSNVNHGGDDSSSSSSVEAASDSMGEQTHAPTESSWNVGAAEARWVAISKMLVLAVIALAAVGCGIATYEFTRSSEHSDFENEVCA